MSSTFIALPVTGESFLLETDQGRRRWAILVDGGQNATHRTKGHPLPKAVGSVAPHLRQIDIAICTHNDADHSGGFPSFLDEWLRAGGRIAEVWLPWRWSAALPTVLTDPDGFMGLLAAGARKATELIQERVGSPELATLDHRERTSRGSQNIESLIREAGRNSLRDYERGKPVPAHKPLEVFAKNARSGNVARALGLAPTEAAGVLQLLEETDAASIPLVERVSTSWITWKTESSAVESRTRSLLRSTTETAEKIRQIAETALRHDILVRWFDFDQFERGAPASGGEPGFLVPLSAVEMEAPKPELDGVRLFFSLRLTEQNVESLVFQRLESESEPGVIFLGDSRLAFGIDKPVGDFPKPPALPRKRAIITAAHHGSRVNDRAYTVLDQWLGNPLSDQCLFIRNGGMWKQTLGQYLSKSNRRCAQCRQCFKDGLQQNVVVIAKKGNWLWPPKARSCGTPEGNAPTISMVTQLNSASPTPSLTLARLIGWRRKQPGR